MATKHKLSTNRPGNSINQSVHYIMTQYSITMQKGSSQDYRAQGTRPVHGGDDSQRAQSQN